MDGIHRNTDFEKSVDILCAVRGRVLIFDSVFNQVFNQATISPKLYFMNKIYSTLLFVGLLFFSVAAQAQVNRGFSFQGYARSFDGAALTNQSVTVQFSIYPFGASAEYVENQTVTTDAYGVFQLFVGAGGSGTRSVTTGVFNNIIFGGKNYWLKVEVRSGGGSYATISDTQLAAVPYSKSAERADNSKSAERADNGVPPGTILAFASNNVPAGYFLCDGGPLNKDEFPELFNAIGYTWGGSGSTFNKPDTRGLFLRGWDRGASRDPDRNARFSQRSGSASGDNVGSEQNNIFGNHGHFGQTTGGGGHTHSHNANGGNFPGSQGIVRSTGSNSTNSGGDNDGGNEFSLASKFALTIDGVGDHTHTVKEEGGSETRPKNVYVNYIVKF
jgi:hypothetical protein